MALSAEVQQLRDAFDAMVTRVQADLAAKTAELSALQAKVDAGVMSDEDKAAIAGMTPVAAALDVNNPATLPPAPAAQPTPAAGGTEAK